jgi:hypothetical protein
MIHVSDKRRILSKAEGEQILQSLHFAAPSSLPLRMFVAYPLRSISS